MNDRWHVLREAAREASVFGLNGITSPNTELKKKYPSSLPRARTLIVNIHFHHRTHLTPQASSKNLGGHLDSVMQAITQQNPKFANRVAWILSGKNDDAVVIRWRLGKLQNKMQRKFWMEQKTLYDNLNLDLTVVRLMKPFASHDGLQKCCCFDIDGNS
jgi:hypothetical protein